jgi:hypothetical protein
VELLDYRPPRNKEPPLEKPDRSRVVLHPNSETIWADICLLNQKSESKWTDKDALQIEARILVCFISFRCGYSRGIKRTTSADCHSTAVMFGPEPSLDPHCKQRSQSIHSRCTYFSETKGIRVRPRRRRNR